MNKVKGYKPNKRFPVKSSIPKTGNNPSHNGKKWLAALTISAPLIGICLKHWLGNRNKKKEQQREHKNKTAQITQTGKTRIDAIDRTHEHKMEEKEKDLEIASEKMEKEYEIWERKEQFRENQAQKKLYEIDYDHPCENVSDIINKPNRITKFSYISDTPITKGDFVCIHAIPGMGKSIVVNQILAGASSGTPTGLGCYPVDNVTPMYALLYDAEQTDEDIQVRYGEGDTDVLNIDRVQDCFFDDNPMLLVKDIERKVWAEQTDSIVCIDNTTKIFPTLKAKMVTKTVRALEDLQARAKKDGFSLTIILVTHSVKDPKKSKDVANMSGSANWSRFTKTVISLSPTESDSLKVMKIEKNRRGKKQGEEFILRLVQEPYLHFVNDDAATEAHLQQKPSKEELRKWPSKIRGVSRLLAIEIESAYVPRKYGAGKLYQQFQGRPGVVNEKQIQRIIKDVQVLRNKLDA